MDPITVAAGVAVGTAVVGGLMQWYQSEKARRASQDKLDEIESIFNSLVPPDYDLSIEDNPIVAGQIPEAALNWQTITPEQYTQLETFQPQLAEFVAEKAPELPQVSAAATQGREAQLGALSKYRQIASSDFDPELQQALQQASSAANRDAQSRQASIMQDAARRGQAGSIATLASQLQGGSDAMERQAQQSMAAAAEGYRNRLRALDQSANLGGDIRSSEMGESYRNAGLLNDANERATRRYQDWLSGNADTANKARLGNINQAQDLANANVDARNQSAVRERDNANKLATQQYDQRRDERDYQDSVKKWNAAQKVDQSRYRNDLTQQRFNNEMSIAKGKAGLGDAAIGQIAGRARDTQNQIQGVTDAVGKSALAVGYAKQKQPRPSSDNWQYEDENNNPDPDEEDDDGWFGRGAGRY